uniref:Uncharacterized protein n=1 Tax=Caloglossa beccarii TaxID=131038 RepID=A0A1Z1M896_9FLOR|nr:hypothetical protein [Caloglossa beccarii]ARW62189.1 hypothetical protein [Caloglossa beccarii]
MYLSSLIKLIKLENYLYLKLFLLFLFIIVTFIENLLLKIDL